MFICIDKLQLFNFSFNFQLFPELSLRACYHVFTGNKGTAGAFPQPAAMFIGMPLIYLDMPVIRYKPDFHNQMKRPSFKRNASDMRSPQRLPVFIVQVPEFSHKRSSFFRHLIESSSSRMDITWPESNKTALIPKNITSDALYNLPYPKILPYRSLLE